MFGMVRKRFLKLESFLNVSPSLTTGTVENIRLGFITSLPCSREYKSLVMRRRSEQLLTCIASQIVNHEYQVRCLTILTGKKRDRGTLIPWAFLKCLTAAPIAVSS